MAESYENSLDETLIGLLQKGLISVEYNEKLEASISITQLGRDVMARFEHE